MGSNVTEDKTNAAQELNNRKIKNNLGINTKACLESAPSKGKQNLGINTYEVGWNQHRTIRKVSMEFV
jgi:hypothetical protein